MVKAVLNKSQPASSPWAAGAGANRLRKSSSSTQAPLRFGFPPKSIRKTFATLAVMLGFFLQPFLSRSTADLSELNGRSESYQDLFYLGETLIFLRLHMVVDGKPWTETRASMAGRQFELLDIDKDGFLLPQQLANLPLVNLDPANEQLWDTQTADHQLSLQEFLDVFETYGQPNFLLAEGDSRAVSRVKLFPHLDENQNGKVDLEELQTARQSLARLDYDDDETISTTELAPFANPLFQQPIAGREQPLTNNSPFLAATSTSKEELATALLRRYAADSDSDTPSIALGTFGNAERMARFDKNRDGALDHPEVTQYLRDRKPDVSLQIELPARRSLRPKVKLLADEIGASNRRPSRIRGSSRLMLRVGKTGLDVRTLSSLTKNSDNRNFFLLEFLQADQDKNKYVDSEEFAMLNLGASFEQLDSDQDEKIFRNELVAYLERDNFAAQTQLVLSVAADSTTLFAEFDRNEDQRLSAREFADMPNRLQYLDLDGDNSIDMTEMSHEYRLMFSLGRPRLFQQAMSMQRNSNTPTPRATPNRNAPDWFRKMDRNQDGDLSWREFLGKRTTFDSLDKNSDGLITVEEIEHPIGLKDRNL